MILLGILIGIFIGSCAGVIIMAVVAVAHESREEADRMDEQAEQEDVCIEGRTVKSQIDLQMQKISEAWEQYNENHAEQEGEGNDS